MKLLRTLLVSAIALVAVQAPAIAAYTYTFIPVPAGQYGAPTFTDISKSSVQTTTVPNMYLEPLGLTGPYLVVSSQGGTPGIATIDTHDVTSYSFVWGSPDTFNVIDIIGTGGLSGIVQYSGVNLASQFGITANGDNNNTGLFTITASGNNVIEGLVLRSSGVAFEVAAPVPEPETYALLLAGLGALGFMARRRQNA